jgi:hypothetical protein
VKKTARRLSAKSTRNCSIPSAIASPFRPNPGQV